MHAANYRDLPPNLCGFLNRDADVQRPLDAFELHSLIEIYDPVKLPLGIRLDRWQLSTLTNQCERLGCHDWFFNRGIQLFYWALRLLSDVWKFIREKDWFDLTRATLPMWTFKRSLKNDQFTFWIHILGQKYFFTNNVMECYSQKVYFVTCYQTVMIRL